jgi:hypothetical protein
MSKYVVMRLNYKPNPYTGKSHLPFYELFNHTSTKYSNNEPYFSANISRKHCEFHSVEKKDIDRILKLAQNNISHGFKKDSKKGTIFVLKLNSPSLKHIVKNFR